MKKLGEIDSDTENVIITRPIVHKNHYQTGNETPQDFNSREKFGRKEKEEYHEINAVLTFSPLFPASH